MKRLFTASLLALAFAGLVGATASADGRATTVRDAESRVEAQVDAHLRSVLPRLAATARAR